MIKNPLKKFDTLSTGNGASSNFFRAGCFFASGLVVWKRYESFHNLAWYFYVMGVMWVVVVTGSLALGSFQVLRKTKIKWYERQ